MPTYEYRCRSCGHEFELWQRITAPPARKCPRCRGQRAQRLISGSMFLLKGAGWYKDGYASAQPAAKSADHESAGNTKPQSAQASGG